MTSHLDSTVVDFVVERGRFDRVKFVQEPVDTLAPEPGQVLLKIDKFALTANNITYALMGDLMSYWKFFPAEAGWGKIPVWGFAEVTRSRHEGVGEGERVYGYFPMSTHLRAQPAQLKKASFTDGAAHRQELHPIYNRYTLTARDPGFRAGSEELQALLRPLFTTSFLIDDFLADNDFFGAGAALLSSASSKTAAGVAFLLQRNRPQRASYQIIGLTSPGNVELVESLGFYDRVVSYGDLRTLPQNQPIAFVDIAGNSKVQSEAHHHFGDSMKCSCQVGASHWQQVAASSQKPAAAPLPGAQPTPFFAPAQLQKRNQELGAGKVQESMNGAWIDFTAVASSWIQVVEGRGQAAVERAYLEMLAGRSRPDQGQILSLWD